MKELVPAVLALAEHPVPHCADPARHYAQSLVRIDEAGNNARSAKGLVGLQRAATPLKGLKKIEHQLAAELNRTVGKGVSKL